MRSIKGFSGSYITKCALQLAPLIFVRPGELRHAEWQEIDFEKKEWRIPSKKMKMREPHIVPLSSQVIEILQSIHPLTGNDQYIFPSIRSATRSMSENTINGALRRIRVEEYVIRTGDKTPYQYSIEAHLMEKWGTNSIADPAYDAGSHCIMFEMTLPKVIDDEYAFDWKKGEMAPKMPEPTERFEETLRFDLRYSIDTQLSHAKGHLMRCKEYLKQGIIPIAEIRKNGINRTYLPKYLRAYDAHQAGASNLEITKYLYPEREIVLKNTKCDDKHERDSNEQLGYRTAKKGIELVMGGYKEFLELL